MGNFFFYAIGDCNTIGANGLDPVDTIPAALSALLRADGKDVELFNAGHTMTTTREGVSRVVRQVKKPDLILINFGLVDAWVTAMPQVYVPYYPDSFFRRLGRRLLKVTKKRMRSGFIRKLVGEGEVVSPGEYKANITRMVALARAENPKVCVVLWGTPWARSNPQRSENIAHYNGLLQELARELDVLYCDTWPVLKQLSEKDAYLDEVHLSGKSARLIARRIYDTLSESGCLGKLP